MSFQNRTVRVKDSKGLRQIASLLRHPGREFHVFDLATLADPTTRKVGFPHIDPRTVSELPIRSTPDADSGELIDSKARVAYKQRIIELREQLEDARELSEEERIAQLEDEIDLINRELTTSFGLGGRSRKAAAPAERARINVTKNISRAFSQIEASHGSLGRLLRSTIRTGIFCSYNPNPDFPVAWSFETETKTEGLGQNLNLGLRVSSAASLLHNLARQHPLVGREAERHELRRLFGEVASCGRGALALIAGPPGVGKTRLIAELSNEAAAAELLIGRCYEGEGVPYQPFIEILENITGRMVDSKALRSLLGEDAVEIARLLPNLRRTLTDLPAPLEIGPEQARRLMFQALCRILTRHLGSRSGIIVIEDLHWADESTLSMLLHLVHQLPELRALFIGSYRDSDLDVHANLAKILEELTRNRSAVQLALCGLSRDESAQMVENLSGKVPPPNLVNAIYRETDGNPFFVEELLGYLAQRNRLYDPGGEFRSNFEIGEADVPQSVRLIVGRRLALLGDLTRKALGVGAVIGRSFTLDLLQASTGEDMDALLDRVDEVQAAGLVSSMAGGKVEFRHELVRQAVLSRLSLARLERLHLAVADAFERVDEGASDERAAVLAYHLRRAGRLAKPSRTIKYLTLAAERSFQQSALQDSEGHYRAALSILDALPETEERDAGELGLQTALATVLLGRSWGAKEKELPLRRAYELCQRVNRPKQFVTTLIQLGQVYIQQLRLTEALEVTERAINVAQGLGEPVLELVTWHNLGETHFWSGDLKAARTHTERAVAMSGHIPPEEFTRSVGVGHDWWALSTCLLSNVNLILGMPGQVRTTGERIAERARSSLHPFSKAAGLMFAAHAEHLMAEPLSEAACGYLRECRRLCDDYGFSEVRAYVQLWEGWDRFLKGERSSGIAELKDAIEKLDALESHILSSWRLALLATAQIVLGEFEAAGSTCARAFDLIKQTKGRWCEAELHRVAAEVILEKPGGELESAEQHLRRAIEIAREQAAKWWELRATTNLAQVLASTDRKTEARKMLGAIYHWFTEGFESRSLKQAAALLRELEA